MKNVLAFVKKVNCFPFHFKVYLTSDYVATGVYIIQFFWKNYIFLQDVFSFLNLYVWRGACEYRYL